MRSRLAAALSAAGLLFQPLSAGSAAAAPGVSMGIRLLFALVDSNGDGRITKAEARVLSDRIFDQLDGNHDILVTEAELDAARARAGVDPARAGEARKAFREIDGNHDGKVSLAEWNARVAVEFARLDANRDGVITLADLSGRDLDVPAGAAGVMMP
jgi:Ca2+-binding EF-hand superfamily protein